MVRRHVISTRKLKFDIEFEIIHFILHFHEDFILQYSMRRHFLPFYYKLKHPWFRLETIRIKNRVTQFIHRKHMLLRSSICIPDNVVSVRLILLIKK